jgi:hypothetical protein
MFRPLKWVQGIKKFLFYSLNILIDIKKGNNHCFCEQFINSLKTVILVSKKLHNFKDKNYVIEYLNAFIFNIIHGMYSLLITFWCLVKFKCVFLSPIFFTLNILNICYLNNFDKSASLLSFYSGFKSISRICTS